MTTESLRRRAALQVLEPWLDADALQQALQLQAQTVRDNAVSSLIRFIDELGQRHDWDAPVRKRLYAQLFQAVQAPPESLPADPWVQARPPLVAPTTRSPAWDATQVAGVPGQPPAVAAPTAPAGVQTPVPVSLAVDAAAVTMFAHLTRDILAQVARLHPEAPAAVAQSVLGRVSTLSLSTSVLAEVQQAWSVPGAQDWRLEHPASDLRRLMGALQDALIEAFGVVGTRHVLQRAVQGAQSLPAARECPPQDLLRWL